MKEINIIKEYIRSTQSDKRFLHTCGVAEECERLADLLEFSKEDRKKLCIAGWLHDITKESDITIQESICREFNIEIPEKGYSDPVLHARTGAYYAKEKFPDLVDEKIFSAIYNHTTGCRGMSVFDMIVCFADFIEPSRKYDGCRHLREEFYRDVEREDPTAVLLRCIRKSFDMTITSLIDKEVTIDQETIDARNYLIEISASQPKEVKK
ncbi:MAG: bis(5'-nucleosyl)-tetraphosphatase (symmetrical) YqeK [Clostridia bacterium]|nr:bis(5'-nucleosyl)-tetraphosphatase (symmetrical) YqeK [Clostridia bacterium]